MDGLVNPSPSFWRGRKVLVTGHTGFKGSWLTRWLAQMGSDVSGFALAPATQPSLFDLAAEAVRSAIGDIRDAASVDRCLDEARPEIVFHMAAQPIVRVSYQDPVATYATNIMGTAHVLDAIRRAPHSVRAAVVVTTDKCYENREWAWPYRESDALGGHDPYSSSKSGAELVTASYRSSFFPPAKLKEHGVGIASARAGNVIGGGDWAQDRLIPDLLRGFGQARVVPIRYPNAIRPWQHVLEPLAGYLLLAQRIVEGDEAACSAWNFGPRQDDVWSVRHVADTVARAFGRGARWDTPGAEAPHEAHHLRLDSSRARAHLGWAPRWSVREALDRTVNCYDALARAKGAEAARGVLDADIASYLSVRSDPSKG